jgi:Leucine-rich repeat (LRR) protein
LRIGQKPLVGFSSLKGLTGLLFLDVNSTGISDLSAVASMPKLVNLNAASNAITDLTPLEQLANLSLVNLVANQISDVAALAANPGLAKGDFVYLGQNQLTCANQAASIQALEGRGVSVQSDCP